MTSDPERLAAAAQAAGAVGIVLRDNEAGASSPQRLFLSVPGDGDNAPALTFSTADPAAVRGILEAPYIVKAGYSLKRYIQALRREGIDLNGPLADLELMHYLVNPETSHRLDTLVQSYLGLDLELCRSLDGEPADTGAAEADLFSQPSDIGPEDSAAAQRRDAVDASLMLPLRDALLEEFARDPSIEKIYNDIEMPLIPTWSTAACG